MPVTNPIQKIEDIKLDDLVLWSENPRDPMGEELDDAQVLRNAFDYEKDKSRKKWNLRKLAKQMGGYYDTSELPTVVKKDGKNIVYDGNRRVAIAKYAKNPEKFEGIASPFPYKRIPEGFKNIDTIPCNVCDEETALENIERKHFARGSWGILERDIFLNKHRGKDETRFQIFDNATGLISANPKLNQRFVRDEVLTESNLNSIGFSLDGELKSIYTPDVARKILSELAKVIIGKEIDTRKGRLTAGMLGKSLKKLTPSLKKLIKATKPENKNLNKLPEIKLGKVTERNKPSPPSMFPYDIELKKGEVNDLYNDLRDLSEYYNKNREDLSEAFPRLFSIGLRVIAEAATPTQKSSDISTYVKKYFDAAYKNLSPKDRNTVSRHGADSHGTLVRILQSGAHTKNIAPSHEHSCNISIIVGEMIRISHKKP